MNLININGKDLDNIKETGFYKGKDILNSPFEQEVFLQVTNYKEEIIQVMFTKDVVLRRIIGITKDIPYPYFKWHHLNKNGLYEEFNQKNPLN